MNPEEKKKRRKREKSGEKKRKGQEKEKNKRRIGVVRRGKNYEIGRKSDIPVGVVAKRRQKSDHCWDRCI